MSILRKLTRILITGISLALFLGLSNPRAEAQESGAARVKDIAVVRGVRENQLVGIGIITGLAGKGDSTNSVLTKESVSNLLSAFGIQIDADDVRSKNAAVVTVSAALPAFSAPGDRLTVHVASLGDATDIAGGVLLQTNLKAANGATYAVAQGPVSTDATGGGNRTVGSIPRGAIVEREIESQFVNDEAVVLVLHRADFSTAQSVVDAIRAARPEIEATALNASVIRVQLPGDVSDPVDPIEFIAQLEQIRITPDVPARVVINERSGVIVLGGDVRIGPVGISYRENEMRLRGAGVYGDQQENAFLIDPTATVSDFVLLLQDLDVDADTVIEILKLIERAGALYGTLIIE